MTDGWARVRQCMLLVRLRVSCLSGWVNKCLICVARTTLMHAVVFIELHSHSIEAKMYACVCAVRLAHLSMYVPRNTIKFRSMDNVDGWSERSMAPMWHKIWCAIRRNGKLEKNEFIYFLLPMRSDANQHQLFARHSLSLGHSHSNRAAQRFHFTQTFSCTRTECIKCSFYFVTAYSRTCDYLVLFGLNEFVRTLRQFILHER